MVAWELYGARGVSYSPKALEIMKRLESEPESRQLDTCIARHTSVSRPTFRGIDVDTKMGAITGLS